MNEKDIVKIIKDSWVDEFYGYVAMCPTCDCRWIMGNDDELKYCPACRQAVKWDDGIRL